MENITGNELMEIGKKLEKKRFELTDDELERINAGFKETNKSLYTFGLEIKCPVCGASGANDFASGVRVDKTQRTVEYHCNCGTDFIVKDGYAIIKKDWLSLCKKKGYSYNA